MSVAADVSLATVKKELEAVAEYTAAAGLQLSSDSLGEQNLARNTPCIRLQSTL